MGKSKLIECVFAAFFVGGISVVSMVSMGSSSSSGSLVSNPVTITPMQQTVPKNRSQTTKVVAPIKNNGSQSKLDRQHQTTSIYHSSEWESLWLQNIRVWQEGGICQALGKQHMQIRAFMNDTCSARTDTPWCLIDDSVHQLWYHTVDGRVQTSKPGEVHRMFETRPISPSNQKIWSWFERRDEITGEITYDFIEPLVSHLRHPLACCQHGKGIDSSFFIDRSYVLPGVVGNRKCYLFDAGASSWNDGAGGPSLSYFAQVWKRHGFEWEHIEAWEGSTPSARFYSTVPATWKGRTDYHQEWISTKPDKHPFVPSVIKAKVKNSDYVVFKLDIDSKAVETSIVDYLLSWDDLDLVDEFLWEHHVKNYLMAPAWAASQDMSMSIADSYQYFLKLRKRGVRAHSWV